MAAASLLNSVTKVRKRPTLCTNILYINKMMFRGRGKWGGVSWLVRDDIILLGRVFYYTCVSFLPFRQIILVSFHSFRYIIAFRL